MTEGAPAVHDAEVRPVSISSANGLDAVNRAMTVVEEGGEPVEASVEGVAVVELDPEEITVGYGGLPNEHGEVQLDAAVMNGPTRGVGAVAALKGVKTPSRVALAVMRYTDHVLLVGEDARTFARLMGFKADEDLLTPEARRRWLEWRARLSSDDDWLTPEESGEQIPPFESREGRGMLDAVDGVRPTGTISCGTIDSNGDLAGAASTSGLAFKIPGRVGDSSVIGAGIYVDSDVGVCGSTGRGEAVIKTCGSFAVVELMRQGLSPTDAALEALRRIVRWTVEPRLLTEDGHPNFNVNYYAINRSGDFGAASIWAGCRYAVNVDGRSELRDSAYLVERE